MKAVVERAVVGGLPAGQSAHHELAVGRDRHALLVGQPDLSADRLAVHAVIRLAGAPEFLVGAHFDHVVGGPGEVFDCVHVVAAGRGELLPHPRLVGLGEHGIAGRQAAAEDGDTLEVLGDREILRGTGPIAAVGRDELGDDRIAEFVLRQRQFEGNLLRLSREADRQARHLHPVAEAVLEQDLDRAAASRAPEVGHGGDAPQRLARPVADLVDRNAGHGAREREGPDLNLVEQKVDRIGRTKREFECEFLIVGKIGIERRSRRIDARLVPLHHLLFEELRDNLLVDLGPNRECQRPFAAVRDPCGADLRLVAEGKGRGLPPPRNGAACDTTHP